MKAEEYRRVKDNNMTNHQSEIEDLDIKTIQNKWEDGKRPKKTQ